GVIASHLFDDREVPALFGSDQPDRWGALTAPENPALSTMSAEGMDSSSIASPMTVNTEMDLDGVEETRDLSVLVPEAVPELASATDLEPIPGVKLQIVPEDAVPPLETETAMEPAVESLVQAQAGEPSVNEVEADAAHDEPELGSTQEQVTVEPMGIAILPEEGLADEPLPQVRQSVAKDSDGRGAGDEAMRTGRYLEAMRLYGEWLRADRQARGR
ncbi:MAG TPA: hypothetical protein VNM48_06745, partial [Chloroflexota bacterium]|nr:hypothetical protein [Chloroflexota bacterium]